MNKSIIKDALILFVITLIAGFGLGAVYQITAEPIEKANYNIQQEAYKTVFPDAAKFVDMDGFDSDAATKIVSDAGYPDTVEGCVLAEDNSGNTLGYVITVTDPNSYGGNVTFSLGITEDGTLNGYSITSINDTPGLGMKAKEASFSDQFKDKQVDSFTVTKTGASSDSEIDAISGATITSKAVTSGVNAGLAYYKELTTGGAN